MATGSQYGGAEIQAAGQGPDEGTGRLAGGNPQNQPNNRENQLEKGTRPTTDETPPQQNKKNSQANMKIATLNMQGRGSPSAYDPKSKWHMINQIVKDNKISILTLQETHLDDDDRAKINELYHQLKIFSSPDPDNPKGARGVAIVLNTRLFKNTDATTTTIIPGRAILTEVNWHANDTFHILNIYAPNNTSDNAAF